MALKNQDKVYWTMVQMMLNIAWTVKAKEMCKTVVKEVTVLTISVEEETWLAIFNVWKASWRRTKDVKALYFIATDVGTTILKIGNMDITIWNK